MLRDLDLPIPVARDGRRLEILGDGIPLFRGALLAIDANFVSPLHCDGSARPGSAHKDGEALTIARRRKERTYQSWLVAVLVVLAGKIGGQKPKPEASHLFFDDELNKRGD